MDEISQDDRIGIYIKKNLPGVVVLYVSPSSSDESDIFSENITFKIGIYITLVPSSLKVSTLNNYLCMENVADKILRISRYTLYSIYISYV